MVAITRSPNLFIFREIRGLRTGYAGGQPEITLARDKEGTLDNRQDDGVCIRRNYGSCNSCTVWGMRADGLLVQPYDLLMLFTEDDTTVDLRWYSPIFKRHIFNRDKFKTIVLMINVYSIVTVSSLRFNSFVD